jgi:hypothetical protein
LKTLGPVLTPEFDAAVWVVCRYHLGISALLNSEQATFRHGERCVASANGLLPETGQSVVWPVGPDVVVVVPGAGSSTIGGPKRFWVAIDRRRRGCRCHGRRLRRTVGLKSVEMSPLVKTGQHGTHATTVDFKTHPDDACDHDGADSGNDDDDYYTAKGRPPER